MTLQPKALGKAKRMCKWPKLSVTCYGNNLNVSQLIGMLSSTFKKKTENNLAMANPNSSCCRVGKKCLNASPGTQQTFKHFAGLLITRAKN